MLSLLRLERKQKNYSNPFRIRIFLFLSYSFGIETINTFIHSRSSLENHTRFQTKMGKIYNRFQTKTAQNPTRWGGTYLNGLYKGVPSPPGIQVSIYKTIGCRCEVSLFLFHVCRFMFAFIFLNIFYISGSPWY